MDAQFVLKNRQLSPGEIFNLKILSRDTDLQSCLHELCQMFG